MIRAFGIAVAVALGCAVFAGPAAAPNDESGAIFDRITEWAIDYSAGDGPPPASMWRIVPPPERFSIVERDGGKALRVDGDGLRFTPFILLDGRVLDRFSGTVLVDMELAFPEPPPAGIDHQFYFGLSCAGSKRVQAVLGLGGNRGEGTFSAIELPTVPCGRFFTVRIALDVDANSGTLWIDGRKYACTDLPRMMPYKNYLCFGTGGKSIDGKFELRKLRVTATEMKPDKRTQGKKR